MYNNNYRKSQKHLEETLVLKAHRMAIAWVWPEDDDADSRTEAEKYHAKVLRAMLAAGLRRLEEEGRNPMAVSLVSEVLPDANVMGLIYKRMSANITDEAISRSVGSLVMEQLYGQRDRLLFHLVNAEDCANAYGYGQELEARMRQEIAEGKNPLAKTARQLGLELADMRAGALSARQERERLEAETDAFAAATLVEGSPQPGTIKGNVEKDESPLLNGQAAVPHVVMDRYGSHVDAALLG
jgi:hypothetical protein